MKRLVFSMIVGVMATVAHATECSVPTSPTVVTIKSAGATGSNTTISATLKPHAAGASVNLTGFEVTGGSTPTTSLAVLTITGLVGGTITYMIPVALNSGVISYAINFPCPLTGIVNTNVGATLTPAVAPSFTAALVIHGF
jgi:hypothetical protein